MGVGSGGKPRYIFRLVLLFLPGLEKWLKGFKAAAPIGDVPAGVTGVGGSLLPGPIAPAPVAESSLSTLP